MHDDNHEHANADSLSPPQIHVMSLGTLLAVFASLLALTGLTVYAAHALTGVWETWVSIAIATLKATLVALYFMHLRYDRSFNSIILVVAIACVGLFLALSLADVEAYQPNVIQP